MADVTLLKSSARADFGAAAVTQLRVIGALVLREMRTRFGRTSLGYLWAVVSPVFGIAILATLYTAIGRAVPVGDSLPLFLATGLLSYRTFTGLTQRMLSAISSNAALFAFPIVKPLDAIFARSLLETMTSLGACFIVLGGIWALGFGTLPTKPLEVAAAFCAMAMLGTGVGTINAIVGRFSPAWDRLFSLFQRPLFFVSGIFYLPEAVPQPFLSWLLWNPLLHGVEWFRAGYYTDYGLHTLDRGYLLTCGLATMLIGLAAERALRGKGRLR